MATVFAQPVPDTVLQFGALETWYLSLANAMLGNTATPADGFDADLQSTVVQTPSTDAGFTASDSAYDALVNAFAGFADAGLDNLAQELSDQVGALNVPENAFFGAVAGLPSLSGLPGVPSSINIPSFNVSTGIPAPISLPNPPVSTPKPTTQFPAPPPRPILPPVGEPFPSACDPGTDVYYGGMPPGAAGACSDSFGMPLDCGCGCSPLTIEQCGGGAGAEPPEYEVAYHE